MSAAAAADAIAQCACLNFRRATRAVTRLYDSVLEPTGLRSTQFIVLGSIYAETRISRPKLAQALGLERSALTRRLIPLERDGLLRVSQTRPGGPSLIELTPKGRRTTNEAVALWQEAQDRLVSALGQDNWALLLDALQTLPNKADSA